MHRLQRDLVLVSGLLTLLVGCGQGGGQKGSDGKAGSLAATPLAAAPLAAASAAFRDDPTPLPEGIVRGDTCTLPLWLATPNVGSAPTVVKGDLAAFAGDFLPVDGSGASAWGGRDLFYRLELRAGDTYRFTLRQQSGALGLFGFSSCAMPEKSIVFSGVADKAVFYTATEAGSIWLGVDAKGDYTAKGTFELEVLRLASVSVGSAGSDTAGVAGGSDRCEGAPALVPGLRVMGNSKGATTQVTASLKGSAVAWPGPDHFFALTVKKGASYDLELDTMGTFAGGLYLLADCGQLAGSALAEGGSAAPLSWTADRDGTVVVGVDSSEQGVGGPYQIAAAERPAK